MAGAEPELRVSAATLSRVLLPGPPDGRPLLALERKATLMPSGEVFFRAQPFGGAVRIRDQAALRERVGAFRFDHPRSAQEQDLRVFISPGQWPALRQVCVAEMAGSSGAILDASPIRELVEEFQDALRVFLRPEQYACRPAGFVISDRPSPTTSGRSPGSPTVRVYRIYEVQVLDPDLQQALLNSSQRLADADLESLARADLRRGGQGRANAVLVLPLEEVTRHYLGLPPTRRGEQTVLAGHALDPSVAAVLEGVAIEPQITIPYPRNSQA